MSGLVRAAWKAPSAVPGPPQRVWRDGVLLASLALLAIAEGVLRTDLSLPALSVVVTLAALPTLLWRRTLPLPMLLIAMAPLDLALGTSILRVGLFVLVLVYALFRWGNGRDLIFGSVVLVAAVAFAPVRGGSLLDVVGGSALILGTVLLGMTFRHRAASRQRLIDGIRVREREQLARNLHDTVAHHVAAISIRARAGLAVAEHDPRAAHEALTAIQAEAGKTLSEMRSMVRVLRHEETADLTPPPRLADIERLAGRGPGAVTVTVTVSDDESVPPPVAAAVFRLAQESVTNALRHARHVTRVEVMVDVDRSGLRLQVSDDGENAASSPAPGLGIIGMKERAALLGGMCEAGPSSEGGWIVAAVLPRTGWAR
jgi:signal transduction histidine kinase